MDNSRTDALVTLPEPLPADLRFLEPGATIEQLIRASAENHIAWFGEDFRKENGVRWKEGIIAFPEMSEAVASQQLDAIVDYHRARTPKQVACWSLEPPQPEDLGARLVARGFEWGWKPHWMGLELALMRTDFSVPEGLQFTVEDAPDWEVDDLPYYTRRPADAPPPVAPSVLPGERRRWRFGAWLNGKIVGQSALQLTTGSLGVAGIYNVGVVPGARKQGIGRAVSIAACQYARALGAHYALLNAATHIYDQIGFVSLGYGQTWFLQTEALTAPAPTLTQIAYFEAVGRGRPEELDALRQQTPDEDLEVPLASGMTLMVLAVQMKKPVSAEWLIAQGVTLEILPAWDLGWKERAREMLRQSPDLANRTFGRIGLTPLHEAAARGDKELAELLLTANPDLTIRDRQYNGIPLGWAHACGHPEIATLIEAHERSRTK